MAQKMYQKSVPFQKVIFPLRMEGGWGASHPLPIPDSTTSLAETPLVLCIPLLPRRASTSANFLSISSGFHSLSSSSARSLSLQSTCNHTVSHRGNPFRDSSEDKREFCPGNARVLPRISFGRSGLVVSLLVQWRFASVAVLGL